MKYFKYSDKEIKNIIIEELNKTYDTQISIEIANDCYYSIIEDYMSISPGYVGDILTVVYEDIDTIYNYKLKEGKLERIYSFNVDNDTLDEYGFTDADIICIYRDYLEYGTLEYSLEELKYIKERFINLLKK